MALNNTLMSFSVSDGADFSSAFVNYSQRHGVFGARSMETHHRKVGYFLLYCSARQSGILGETRFHKQKRRLAAG